MLYHMACYIVYHMVDHLVYHTVYHMVYHTAYHMGCPIAYHMVYQMVDHMVHQMVRHMVYQLAENLGAQPSKVQGHLQGRAICKTVSTDLVRERVIQSMELSEGLQQRLTHAHSNYLGISWNGQKSAGKIH